METFDVCDLRKWEIIRNGYQLDSAKLISTRKTTAAVILDYLRRFISAWKRYCYIIIIDCLPKYYVSYIPFLSKGIFQLEYSIRLSEKFLSFYEEITNAQGFLFYIILSNYVRSILFCRDKHRDISQTWFHVCTKVDCCRKHVCERKILSGQPNT